MCATLSCAGWGLSWAKALGPGAYAVVLGFFTVAVVFHVKRGWVERARRTAKQSRRRFRRPVAFIYLLTAVMALIEPMILLVMGVFVVIILIALYLPIFSLGSVQQMG